MLIGLNRQDGDLMCASGDIDDPRSSFARSDIDEPRITFARSDIDDPRITFTRSDRDQVAKMRLDLHARMQRH
jgi:hypothetical protein